MKRFVVFIVYKADYTNEKQLKILRKECQKFAREHSIIREFLVVENDQKLIKDELLNAINYAQVEKASLLTPRFNSVFRNLQVSIKIADLSDCVILNLPKLDIINCAILNAISHKEQNQISTRSSRGISVSKKKRADWITPLTNEARKKGSKLGVETLKAKNAYVKKAVTDLAMQGLTIPLIQKSLFESGIKTKTGNPLSYSTIHKYFKSIE